MDVEGDDSDQKVEKAKEGCENKLREARIAVGNLRKELSRVQVKEAQAQAHIQSLTASPTKSGGQSQPMTQGTGTTMKVYNDALKPALLVIDSNSSDLRMWKETMEAYFQANETDTSIYVSCGYNQANWTESKVLRNTGRSIRLFPCPTLGRSNASDDVPHTVGKVLLHKGPNGFQGNARLVEPIK